VHNLVTKIGFDYKQAEFFDNKIKTDLTIAMERAEFSQALKTDHLLRQPKKLLFMDETNVRLNEQQKRAWGDIRDPANQIKFSEKQFEPISDEYEKDDPDVGLVELQKYTVAQLRSLTKKQLTYWSKPNCEATRRGSDGSRE